MIGYYVHHQGGGHLQRLLTIGQHLAGPVTGLSSLPAPDAWSVQGAWSAPGRVRGWVELPMDNRADRFVDPTANGTLHWVPRHDRGLRRRMAIIAEWIDANDPDLMVVDVSVEVATLCRLLGVPTVVVAMRGDRLDRAHRGAYDAAAALLASWPSEFAVADWPHSWLRKTFHAGAISRFADRSAVPIDNADDPPRVLVLWGSGGNGRPAAAIAAAAEATPRWQWRVADAPPGDADAIWRQLSWADVVVTHGGQNAIAEVAAARRPAVIIAEDRPHSEQADTVRVLGDAGLAVALPDWPQPARWPELLESAHELGGARWQRWTSGNAAARAAAFLGGTARTMRADRDAGSDTGGAVRVGRTVGGTLDVDEIVA